MLNYEVHKNHSKPYLGLRNWIRKVLNLLCAGGGWLKVSSVGEVELVTSCRSEKAEITN